MTVFATCPEKKLTNGGTKLFVVGVKGKEKEKSMDSSAPDVNTSGKSYCEGKYSAEAGKYVNQPQKLRRDAANKIRNIKP